LKKRLPAWGSKKLLLTGGVGLALATARRTESLFVSFSSEKEVLASFA
jgi:hypothetical protein